MKLIYLFIACFVLTLPGCFKGCSGDEEEEVKKYRAGHVTFDRATDTFYGRDGTEIKRTDSRAERITCMLEEPITLIQSYKKYIDLDDPRQTGKEKRVIKGGERNLVLQITSAYWGIKRHHSYYRERYLKGIPFPETDSKQATLELAFADFLTNKYGMGEKAVNLTKLDTRGDWREFLDQRRE